jgi:hypothetical protein
MGNVLIAKGTGADTVGVFNVYANSPQGLYWLKSSGIKAEPVTETRRSCKGVSRGGEEAQEGRRLGNEETPVPAGEKLRSAGASLARAG